MRSYRSRIIDHLHAARSAIEQEPMYEFDFGHWDLREQARHDLRSIIDAIVISPRSARQEPTERNDDV